MKYRYRCGKRVGEWRDTALQAREDAVEAGLGSKEPHDRVPYVDELVEIEREEDGK